MIKDKKRFFKLFCISFAIGAAVAALLFFVVFTNIFYSINMSKGKSSFEKKDYVKAAEYYSSAKTWKPNRQEVYLLLADAYVKAEMYDKAGEVIDQAIQKKIKTDDTGKQQLYITRILILSASGDLAQAAEYTDSIDDQYIMKKIQAERPADISYTPTQGNYDRTLKMELKVPDGETVYYTTDGQMPTKSSNVYVNPINIGNGETKITAVSVNGAGLVSPILRVTYTVSNENATAEFDDAKVELMVRAALSKPAGIIRVKELEGITELDGSGIEGSIKTLSDIELMPNLESLCLDNEKSMVSISQLSSRTKLKYLALTGCDLDTSGINALSNLTELERLDLTDNRISSAGALSGLTKLKWVSLANNSLDDISSLAAATDIEYINASSNRLTSIPDLTSEKLKTLILSKNRISDLSTIHRFTGLTELDISFNAIKNAKNLAKLTKLEYLNISNNDISNFAFLTSLKALTDLNVNSTPFVSAKPVEGLNLIHLYAKDSGLVSINELGRMSNLTALRISGTNVTDISPLRGLEKLDYLDISDCKISNLNVLSELNGLFTLEAKNIDLTGITFVNKDISIVK